jgi:hypothetical protein
MRSRIWGRLAAAVAGAAALAGSASAQTPARAPVVVPQQVVVAQPAPGPTAPTVAIPGAPATLPPAAAVPVAPAPGATVVTGSGGCTNCGPAGSGGTAHRGFVMGATGGYLGTNCSYGQQCNNGCGSLRSDLGTVFGTCKSFFAPCGPRPFGLHGSCNHPVLNPGPCGPFNPCVYDSYLNH